MLYDFIKINQESCEPVYRQLHHELQSAIAGGLLSPGQKVLSIRVAAAELTLSRMTVETAYQQLCMEGYLISKPQRGYFVAERIYQPVLTKAAPVSTAAGARYDFSSRSIDPAYADLRLWQKYMRSILAQEDIITSYGEAQGEAALREALAAYSFVARGVRTSPSQIVIGAGTQPLLTLLCGLLPERKMLTAGIEHPGFPQAEQVFSDYGLDVVHLDRDDIWIHEDIDLYIYLAARTGAEGFKHEMKRRNELVTWRTSRPGRQILEDDYNGELRFLSRPVPSLQGMDEGVIFLGSFSRLLLPSVRIAYMVLPEKLAAVFHQKSRFYNQTAGKVEQLALAEYIRQGQLEKHLRRLRKLYQKKSQAMVLALKKYLGDNIDYELWETELRFILTVNSGLDAAALTALALNCGVVLAPLGTTADGRPQVILSFAGIPLEMIDEGIRVLAECWIQGDTH